MANSIAQGLPPFIVPASAATVQGNSSQIPLDTGGPERFQQVYDASLFGAYPQGIYVTLLAFRVDENLGHSFATTVSDIEVHLSTTPQAVNSLSPIFDLNVGADDKIVAGREPHFLTGGPGAPGVLSPFSVVLDFRSNPLFLYDPAAGNLLLDIKVFTGASTSPFDSFDVAGDSISSVFGYGQTMPSSGQASSLGLATLLGVRNVPEPSTVSFLIFGAATMALFARRIIQRKNKTHESY